MSKNYKTLQELRVVAEPAAATGQKKHFVSPPPFTKHSSAGTGHYRSYSPPPFTRQERSDTTILFGGLHWRVERVLQGAMENLGYTSRILPTASREDLSTGREVADIGQCCPTSFTTGNLANFLRSEAKRTSAEQVAKDYVYVTAGSCGSCRFGQYHQSYELALRNIGMESFRMIFLGQGVLDQVKKGGDGLELNLPFLLGAIWSIVLTDVLQDMEYQVRPYEVHPGETNKVVHECVEYLHEVLRRRPVRGEKLGTLLWHLGTNYFTDAMREVRRRFDRIEVDRLRVKPLVKITGEFYLQTVEGDANYNIHHWLESEGAEVYPATMTVWFDYLMRLSGQNFKDHIGVERYSRLKLGSIHTVQWLLRWTYSRMRRAMGMVPHELPSQRELRDFASPYYHSRLDGGEGDMLIGKALWAYHHKKAHMICELSPYSCMPNTMSVGAMAAVVGRYPDLLYAPLEIKGDAEVHALSRCQMILTEAKKRAQREYEEVLERTGFTEESLREAIDARPELKCATYRVPHYGVAGTAANLVLHLAANTRMKG
jgi:predicted nucleotide-binding protein (sugar kinase/HSP70/actin superfamily)